jgi:hypothetical protein
MTLEDYVTRIGGSNTLLEKVRNVIDIAGEIIPAGDEIKKFFITNTISNGIINFGSLWIFTDNFMLESKTILSDTISIDLLFYKELISSYELTISNFNVKNGTAQENSILAVSGLIQNSIFEMNATGINCENLWEIIQTHIVPNIFYYIEEPEEE